LPSIDDTFSGSPAPKHQVDIAQLFKGKKGILFAVPAAFSPGCSNSHLPSYVKEAKALRQAGAEVVVCVSVNDPFVMAAWAEAQGTEGKVTMVADPRASFTKAIGLDMDATAVLGNVRSCRYAMLIEDSVVKAIEVDKKKPETTLAAPMLAKL